MKDDYTLSTEKPEIYQLLHDTFGVNWDDGLVITYGNVIHCKFKLPNHVLAHEEVHVMQQEKMGRDEWWKKYMEDVKFRLVEETAAYMVQADYIRAHFGRTDRRYLLREIVKHMVKMYGGMCSEAQAKEIIGA